MTEQVDREKLALITRLREAEEALMELQPTEVLVEGSYFPVRDLPVVLANHMRSAVEYAREAKAFMIERDRYRESLREAEAVIEKVREIVEPPKPLELGKSMMRSFDRMIGDLRRALATYKPTNQENGEEA